MAEGPDGRASLWIVGRYQTARAKKWASKRHGSRSKLFHSLNPQLSAAWSSIDKKLDWVHHKAVP